MANAKSVLKILVLQLLFPFFIIGLSGDFWWFDGWLWIILAMLMANIIHIYLFFKNPGLFYERLKKSSDDQVGADKIIYKIVSIIMLSWFAIIPMDVKRYKWSTHFLQFNMNYPLLKWFNFGMMVFGEYIIFRSYYDNSYLSPILRLQKERKQKVVDTGLYAIIRHPMYCGIVVWQLFSSMFFASFYGLLISIATVIVFLIRIGFEEQMLENGLDGYIKYKKKVQYKLLPFII